MVAAEAPEEVEEEAYLAAPEFHWREPNSPVAKSICPFPRRRTPSSRCLRHHTADPARSPPNTITFFSATM